MPIAALVLVLEIVGSVFLVSLPAPKSTAVPKNVLGQTILLAQDETTPSDQTTEPAPATSPDTAPTPSDQTTTPTPDQTTSPAPDQTTPPAPEEPTKPTPDKTANPPSEQTTNPSPEQTATPASNLETAPTPEQTATPVPTAELPTQSLPASESTAEAAMPTPEQTASAAAQTPVLNTDEDIANPEKIDTGSQEEVGKEEQALSTITDLGQKAVVLTTYASDKVIDIDRFTQAKDFSSTTFANARLSNQIEELKTLSPQKLSDLCQQANTILRTAQEVVPDEMEQDLEITRGQCLGF